MSKPAVSMLDRARRDPAVFAEVLMGAPLWPHQLEVVRSPARYRVICAGRQVGKSRLLATLALHKAFAAAGSLVLVVSSGDRSSKRLLEEVASLASASPLLAGSVVDESSSAVVLTNGSRVISVPASQRQIRGWAVDLLIVDEAGFIDPEVWRAAEPSIIARPGSRVVMSSSPWGGADHFFRLLWTRGKAADAQVASWHWPSTVSPLVDADLLEEIRSRESPRYFEREYLAEWTDEQGAYFSTAELDRAVCDVDLIDPDSRDALLTPAVVGVDWGFAHDANTLTVLVGADPVEGKPAFRVAWVEEHFRQPYSAFIGDIARLQFDETRGFDVRRVTCELNGVGAMPSQELVKALMAVGLAPWQVEPVHTTSQLKEDAFGFLKLLMQDGRLLLPRHPALLKQLAALEFEATETGAYRIAVPERAGHDDLVMSLALASLPLFGRDANLVLCPVSQMPSYVPGGRPPMADFVDFFGVSF